MLQEIPSSPFLHMQILNRISLQYAPNANETKNANETNEKRTNASHERCEKRTMHETNARYTNERTK